MIVYILNPRTCQDILKKNVSYFSDFNSFSYEFLNKVNHLNFFQIIRNKR
jgi:hypothetical protein